MWYKTGRVIGKHFTNFQENVIIQLYGDWALGRITSDTYKFAICIQILYSSHTLLSTTLAFFYKFIFKNVDVNIYVTPFHFTLISESVDIRVYHSVMSRHVFLLHTFVNPCGVSFPCRIPQLKHHLRILVYLIWTIRFIDCSFQALSKTNFHPLCSFIFRQTWV